jgi:hypothetical protein
MNSQSQSPRSTTHRQRYQQPTCVLEIWADHAAMSAWSDRPIASNLRFQLKIGDRTIKGNQQQLETTLDTVINYVDRLLAQDSSYTLKHCLTLPRQKQLSLSTLQLFDLVANLEQCTNELVLLPSLELELKRVTPNWLKVAAIFVAAIGVSLGTVRLITPQIARQHSNPVASSSAPSAPDPEALEELPTLPDELRNKVESDLDQLDKLASNEQEAQSVNENIQNGAIDRTSSLPQTDIDPTKPEQDQIAALPKPQSAEQIEQLNDRLAKQPDRLRREDATNAPTDRPADPDEFRRNEASLDDAPTPIDNSGGNRNLKPNASRRAARRTTPPAKIAGQDRQDQNVARSPQPSTPATNAPIVSSGALSESKDELAESASSPQPEAGQRSRNVQPTEPDIVGSSSTNDLNTNEFDRDAEQFGDLAIPNIQVIAITSDRKAISNADRTSLTSSLAQHWRSQVLGNFNDSPSYQQSNPPVTATFLLTLAPGRLNQVSLERNAANSGRWGEQETAKIAAIQRSLATWQPPIAVIDSIRNGSSSIQLKLTVQIEQID